MKILTPGMTESYGEIRTEGDSHLHSKLFLHYRVSMLEVSRQLYRSRWKLQPPIRAPDG